MSCGVVGHELVGTEARRLRPEDAIFAREAGDGLRWYRCLRCDSWLPLPVPEAPRCEHPPEREQIELPLRGRPLRDKWVLRLIAIDRFVHVVVLAVLAAAIFFFVTHRSEVQHDFYRYLTDIQGAFGGPTNNTHRGVLHEIDQAFSLSSSTLDEVGAVVVAYALLELSEGIGLWLRKRWAEYLTFVATIVLLPFEVYELSHSVSVVKVLALVINIAIAVYLIWAKRLFGVRGGGRAEAAALRRDSGWEALERATPRFRPPG